MARMRGTIMRTQSCVAWLMFSRKILAPASIIACKTSADSVAGPRVQMILVLRMARGKRKPRKGESKAVGEMRLARAAEPPHIRSRRRCLRGFHEALRACSCEPAREPQSAIERRTSSSSSPDANGPWAAEEAGLLAVSRTSSQRTSCCPARTNFTGSWCALKSSMKVSSWIGSPYAVAHVGREAHEHHAERSG